MAEFLFEIGLEEVPARMIAGAEAELARRVVAMLGAREVGDTRHGGEELFDASTSGGVGR